MKKLNYSLEAYLHLADQVGIEYFNTVKNHILSYPGVKVAYSWKFERFSHGGETVMKLTLQGRTLNIFYRLDESDFDTSRYHTTNKGAAKIHNATPIHFKVKGPRQLKYALELIDIYFAKKNVQIGPLQNKNYAVKPLSKEVLIDKGLIKVVYGELNIRKK